MISRQSLVSRTRISNAATTRKWAYGAQGPRGRKAIASSHEDRHESQGSLQGFQGAAIQVHHNRQVSALPIAGAPSVAYRSSTMTRRVDHERAPSQGSASAPSACERPRRLRAEGSAIGTAPPGGSLARQVDHLPPSLQPAEIGLRPHSFLHPRLRIRDRDATSHRPGRVKSAASTQQFEPRRHEGH